jgi:hypothetical protein
MILLRGHPSKSHVVVGNPSKGQCAVGTVDHQALSCRP